MPEAHGIGDDLGQRGRIVQAEIEPLAGDGVDHVGGVAEERQPLADEGARHAEGQGIGLRPGLEGEPAELQPEAALEFDQQILGMGFEQGRHVLRALGPDDGRAVLQAAVGLRLVFKRQDREGAGGQKMLHRPALVIAFMGDGGDDAGLLVGPGDPADAGLLAQARARPVGGHQQRGLQAAAARQGNIRAGALNRKALHPLGLEIDASLPAGIEQCGGEVARRDHMREGLVSRPRRLRR